MKMLMFGTWHYNVDNLKLILKFIKLNFSKFDELVALVVPIREAHIVTRKPTKFTPKEQLFWVILSIKHDDAFMWN
jgi:hypothetical protein